MTAFRKFPACSCLAAWLPAYEAELKRRGILPKNGALRIYQLIGGAKASGGTHSTGGCFDLLDLPGGEDLKVARQMGADATWSRLYDWDGRDGMAHVHGVLTGCPHNKPARYQIDAVRAGFNGLGRGGRAARDTGPRPLSGRTWQEGIAWAKAQAKPTPTTRTTVFEAGTFNVKGGTTGFITRVPIIRARVMKQLPHFLLCQELPTGSRLLLSAALKTKYGIGYYGHNKAQYLIRNRQGWQKISSGAHSIGNGRHAVIVRYRHRHTGADMVVATPHPSWEHSAGKARAEEATALVRILNREYPGLPKLIGGDFNDSLKPIADRRHDSFGDALKAAGFHDLYTDVAGAKRHGEQYNTAHQYKTPMPRSGIHLDRFFGTSEFEGVEWTNDAHSGKRGSDHWMVNMRISLRHPVKK